MEIVLCDRSINMINAWNNHFSDIENVLIIQDDINTIDCNAIVSPANSFGFMDGGIDYYISECTGNSNGQ